MMYNSVIDKNERQKMKLEEIKVGMVVVDKHSNEYIVQLVNKDSKLMPVMLKCTKFSSNILVQRAGDVGFSHEGQTFHIYKSKKAARNDGCKNVDVITVKSLKLKGN